jgi:hypothetical protein
MGIRKPVSGECELSCTFFTLMLIRFRLITSMRILIRILPLITGMRICDHRSPDPSRLHFNFLSYHASIGSVHCPLFLNFEPPQLHNLTLMRSRIRPLTLMKIWIRLPKMMWIRHRNTAYVNNAPQDTCMELGREAREAALAASKLGTDSTLTTRMIRFLIHHLVL